MENDFRGRLVDMEIEDINNNNHIYIAIDLKSFYASVECMERGLDPLDTNLVVADSSRTEKTICLAVTPSLKAYGIPGRARLFEVVQKVKEVNQKRLAQLNRSGFVGNSPFASELEQSPALEVGYIVAPPQMALYLKRSTQIYEIYLKYVAPEDIHVYSIDEVFMDVTHYLNGYKMTPKELAVTIIQDILKTTGITATAGIGTNLYLCKVAMDIVAKHIKPDENGVRVAQLDEMCYRRLLWNHKPLTDFWRVGRGYREKLEAVGLYTMGDIARCSIGKATDYYNEDLLYKMFGINAELLIDHAWGYEPTTIAMVKAYEPSVSSISSGQVLHCPYDYEKARLIVQEMTDALVLDLVEKGLVTDQIVLTVGYDIENLRNEKLAQEFKGEVKVDMYGRRIPKHSHGTANLAEKTSSTKRIMEETLALYDRIVNPKLLVRRINVVAGKLAKKEEVQGANSYQQLSLFEDFGENAGQRELEEERLEKERKLQEAMLSVKKKYGKNAMLKGMNLKEGAMAMERNRQIGGHKA